VELNGRWEKVELRFSAWIVGECSSGVEDDESYLVTLLSFVSFPLKERKRSIVQKDPESCTETLTQKPHSSQGVDESTRT
jgi:hypothetical protein